LRHYSVDKTEAAAWFRQAAEAGHAGSQFVLGMMCLK
jgi:TPR repeat protein